jgi:hypothetical protein
MGASDPTIVTKNLLPHTYENFIMLTHNDTKKRKKRRKIIE